MYTIWTIGHSTRSLTEFLQLLKTFEIELLVDVRHYPGSRKFPHFNKDNLATSLPENGFDYKHIIDLGGRRKMEPNSKNDGWRLTSFRAYADYMETTEFNTALDQLKTLATEKRTAIMCAEAVWWSCHRSLISDALKVQGWEVLHIMNQNTATEHPYTSPAKLVNGKLDYSKEK
ncbi:DUF488 domain-containing protein [Aequorivita viscosa]|uniref:Fe-S cluster assembly protein HesB n=1 Tax=Aequorivita viscosa TaxID=797419 RepID=A0A1M6FBF6_9FLAO|nr:DUF488 domain-containing protein [Aequorivita viscosa]SDW66912.1 Protein of unknown function, DUF488 [Aequorivita viscosa]SHI95012.1 Protein of unknown function, DUF488 [Aequorivita viscosa]